MRKYAGLFATAVVLSAVQTATLMAKILCPEIMSWLAALAPTWVPLAIIASALIIILSTNSQNPL